MARTLDEMVHERLYPVLGERLVRIAQPYRRQAYAIVVALGGGALWWRSLDIHAVLVTECRERIITEAGRSDVE